MRRIILATCMLLLASIASPIHAQGEIRTAEPVTYTVDVSAPDPVPSGGVGAVALWAGGGLDAPTSYASKQPYWFYVPHLLDQRSALVACGYANAAPKAILRLPSGREIVMSPQAELALTNEEGGDRFAPIGGEGCYKYVVAWEPGIELGIYTLTLQHEAGNLSYTWAVDYPYCQKLISVEASSRERRDYQMGLAPNTDIVIDFYAQLKDDITDNYTFLTRRVVKTDADGAFFLDIKVARSAPYTFDVVDGWSRFIYALSDTNGKRLSWHHLPDNQFVILPDATPSEPSDFNDLIDVFDTRPCGAYFGRFARVDSTDGLYPYTDFEGAQQATTPFAKDEYLEIFERRLSSANGRTEVWSHVRAADARDGWLIGVAGLTKVDNANFPDQRTYVVVGGDGGFVLPSGVNSWHAIDSVGITGDDQLPIAFLPIGTRVDVVDKPEFSALLKVRYQDKTGYTPSVVPLPWSSSALVEQSAKDIPPLAGTPEWVAIDARGDPILPNTAPKTIINCPGTPPTQFAVGMRGTVIPLANGTARPVNVRDLPVRNGNIVVKMGANTLFTIIDGPSCADGYLWWKIQIDDGPSGWVAEGSMENYFIDPLLQ